MTYQNSNHSGSAAPIVLIRQPEVLRRTALSRATLYEMMAAGRFPKPLKVADRINCWPEAEIDAWIAARIAER